MRLPYGTRTGDEAIDTLTVIAHDRFDDVIRKAKEPGSILLKAVEIDTAGNVWRDGEVDLVAPSFVETMVMGGSSADTR